MLEIVDQILQDNERTPAWLCRKAGVHRSVYTLVKNGDRKLSKRLQNKFAKILKIRKSILFQIKQEKKDGQKTKDKRVSRKI